MSFYERYVALCAEQGYKPQSPEMIEVAGVTSPAISGWKRGAIPSASVLCRLADYFRVSIDYLLCRTAVLSPEETLLLDSYHAATQEGKFHIIQVCMNERGDSHV